MHINYQGTHCTLEELASGIHTGSFKLGRTVTLSSPSTEEDNPDIYDSEGKNRYMVEYTGTLNGIASVRSDSRNASDEVISYRISLGNEIIFENKYCKVLLHRLPN